MLTLPSQLARNFVLNSLLLGIGWWALPTALYCKFHDMTFEVKRFKDLAKKGVDGDVGIIKDADGLGNQGISYRSAKGWLQPIVIKDLPNNVVVTDLAQAITGEKLFYNLVNFFNDVSVTGDFAVIGATDIDLGFTDLFKVEGGNGSQIILETEGFLSLDSSDGLSITSDDISVQASDGISDTSSLFVLPDSISISNNKGAIEIKEQGSGVNAVTLTQNGTDNTAYVRVREDTNTNETDITLHAIDTINDTDSMLFVGSNKSFLLTTNTAGAKALIVRADSVILEGLPIFADNAAAVADDYPVDGVYKTATGELRIVV